MTSKLNTQIFKFLQQLQNRALRIIYNQHIMQYNLRLSTTNLHERANIHRLVYRRQQHLIHYAFDMKLYFVMRCAVSGILKLDSHLISSNS